MEAISQVDSDMRLAQFKRMDYEEVCNYLDRAIGGVTDALKKIERMRTGKSLAGISMTESELRIGLDGALLHLEKRREYAKSQAERFGSDAEYLERSVEDPCHGGHEWYDSNPEQEYGRCEMVCRVCGEVKSYDVPDPNVHPDGSRCRCGALAAGGDCMCFEHVGYED